MNNFQNSKYLDIIKIIGESLHPINYSELKEKIGLADSTLSRDLNWLQNLDIENSLKSNEVDAFYLRKNAYIVSTGINKSKNNRYKLTKVGNDIFNSLFLQKEEVSHVDLVIQEYKIYGKLWNYVNSNRDMFYNKFDNKLQPWTIQTFEFFEDLTESDIKEVLNSIPGPINLRLYNLFEIITTIIFIHPLWKTYATINNLDIPVFTELHFNIINHMPLFKRKFKLFGLFPEIFCIIKEDKLIKEIYFLVERDLKIYYWKGIQNYTHEEIIIRDIVKNVLNELYEVCSEYSNFINQFHIEISIYIKNIIKNLCSNEIQMNKLPLNLLSPQIKDKFEFYLRRKLFLSDIEAIPSQLLTLGATKEIVYEQIEIFKDKSDLEPENYKIKLKLLELLVYNYSNEFRTDLNFYNKFKVDLIEFIEDLIQELIALAPEYKENALILGYIFYNQKYLIKEKALKINEQLLQFYPNEVVLLENLIALYYQQKIWKIEKIKDLTNRALELVKQNSFLHFSDIVIKLIQDKDSVIQNFEDIFSKILKFEPLPENIIKTINFFCNQLNKHSFSNFSLQILEKLIEVINYPELKWIYAENLLINKEYVRAIEEFLKLIDIYPNKIFEGRIFSLLFNRFNELPELNENKKLNNFLKEIIKYLNLVSAPYEWNISESDVKDFQKNREEHLSTLRNELKHINSLLKNNYTLTLPLKIKAIILKALDREKNLESCLSIILKISPNNIWANTEKALLLFKQGKYEQSFKILNFIDELKERENYSISYNFYPYSYILKENDYNIFRLYIDAGKYYESILIIEEFLLNPYSEQKEYITATEIGKDLIFCYREITNNIDKVIKNTLDLADRIDETKEMDSNIINLQKDSSYIRQSLIDYLLNEKQYKRCLELILELSKEYSSILEPRTSSFTPFNRNLFYLAECYLKLNNLIKAKRYYEQSLEDLNDDIRFKAKTNLLLIYPLPEYLKINEKQYYLNKIKKGIKKISLLLEKEVFIENLIFKTKIERSIGNISLFIREREKKEANFFENIRNQIALISGNDKQYYKIVVACSCAITGYIDEMNYFIKKEKVEKSYPIISTLLKTLYCYYKNTFENYNKLNMKLHRLIPNSLIPLLFNLHFLRYKRGINEISKIINLFKTIWMRDHRKPNIYGIEKQIIDYFRNNLTWYPFKWAIKYERYIDDQEQTDIQKLFKVLEFITNKKYNQETELLDFITRFLNHNRKLSEYLSLLLISSSYEFPETKYFIFKLLNPEIEQYELRTFGEIAYQANKLNEFLPMLDEYRKKEINRYKELRIPDWNRRWLEERYVTILLKAFKYTDLNERVAKSMKYLENLEDFPEEKLRYFNILSDLRKHHYKGAEINAYKLIKRFKDHPELKWDDDYFKIWVLSYILLNYNEGKEPKPDDILEELIELLDFKKMEKNPAYFQLLILDVLNHELLERYEKEVLKFAEESFNEIIHSINWSDIKTHNIITEKMYFNRNIIIKFSLNIIKNLDKMIDLLNPNKFNQARKNYLYYIKAMIYFKNNKILKAKDVLEPFINSINEEELYITYEDINDLYLEIIRQV